MRVIGLIGLVGISCLLPACSEEQSAAMRASATASESVIENAVDKASDIMVHVENEESWSFEETASSLDGKVISARRLFVPDDLTTFTATVQCVPESSAVGISIDSYVGSVSEPSPGSEFVSTVQLNIFGMTSVAPLGRVKSKGQEVRELADLFSLSEAASNRIELRNPSVFDAAINAPSELRQKLSPDDINYARVIYDMLPLIVEVNNGTGKHEIVIDQSAQVIRALTQCGGTSDVVTPNGIIRVQAADAARQKADEEAKQREEQLIAQRQAEMDAQKKDICRNRGSHPIYKEMCESEYPNEYAAFQKDIDQIVSDAKRKRCRLDRTSVEKNASSNGVSSEQERIAAMDNCSWFN